jgi:hypothetical protein
MLDPAGFEPLFGQRQEGCLVFWQQFCLGGRLAAGSVL